MEKKKEKVRRARGSVIPLGPQPGYKAGRQDFGIRIPLKERGANGRNKTHYETLRNTTEREAYKYKDQLLAQIDSGQFIQTKSIKMSDLLDEWIKEKERQKLKPDSLYTYTDVVNFYVRPFIGQMYLADVSGATARDLYNTLQDKGYSTATL
ncbi:MAG: N-terminal phage integrase SAM-like domain-containing protein, partial [Acidobacteriota bacterium]|nr:N-terminal phage integrase SAM-like domain-containing protein [Acidobacteriota bacterium]